MKLLLGQLVLRSQRLKIIRGLFGSFSGVRSVILVAVSLAGRYMDSSSGAAPTTSGSPPLSNRLSQTTTTPTVNHRRRASHCAVLRPGPQVPSVNTKWTR